MSDSHAQPLGHGDTSWRPPRRSLLRLLLAGGTGALLAACSSPAPQAAPIQPTTTTTPLSSTGAQPAATQPTSAPPPVSSQPRVGGTLHVGVLGDLLGLDGHLTTGLDSLRRVWDTVTDLDQALDVVPVLAESLELTPDAKRMTVRLRKDVLFHTGRALTSDDLTWNFNRLRDPRVNPTYANLLKPFASMDTPDASTLVVDFDASNPFVIDSLPRLSMLDPVSFQQLGATKPVGTGPFAFVEFVQGDHLTLKRNPAYWNTGKPYLDQLEFRIFTDPQAMVTEFEAGTLDLVIQPALADWVRFQKEGKAQVLINQNSGDYVGFAFNATQAPTDNKLVRQALQFALDRQRIAETVWLGVERPLTLLWFPSAPAYDAAKNQTYTFSLERARALLDQAGVNTIAFDYNYPSVSPAFGKIGQIWQADLDKIGVKVSLKPTDPVALTGSMQRQQYNGVAVGSGIFGQLHGAAVWASPYFGPINNFSGFKDDTFTQLALAAYAEADASKRKPALEVWNSYVLDSSHVTAVSTQFPRAVAKPTLHGAVYSTGGDYLDLTGAWLA